LLTLAAGADTADREYVRRGIEMNLAMARRGEDVPGTAGQLRRIHERGYLAEDLFYRTKLLVASAVDARMAGVSQPVMTSGGSGNQGIVAILTSYSVGREMGVGEERIVESIAAAHLVNAYCKCFVGELSVICGCAMAAGIAAAAAIVYQQAGNDARQITLAVNNVIGDLGGLICDGAKPGCAMKTITAVDTAIRSGLMALEGFGLSPADGVVGRTAEDSIRNLSRVTLEGMFSVDPTVLLILREKDAQRLSS
jgi:L-cysteine desulfidase